MSEEGVLLLEGTQQRRRMSRGAPAAWRAPGPCRTGAREVTGPTSVRALRWAWRMPGGGPGGRRSVRPPRWLHFLPGPLASSSPLPREGPEWPSQAQAVSAPLLTP